MEIIIHRVNTLSKLKEIPHHYGVEIDIRGRDETLFLSHDPLISGKEYTEFTTFISGYTHGTLVINTKEMGYEKKVVDLLTKENVKKYFFLDVESPALYRSAYIEGFRHMAVRFSEYEPVEAVLPYLKGDTPLLEWVWIDTVTCLPMTRQIYDKISSFKLCLVCPSRWGRSKDISVYKEALLRAGIRIDAVMTDLEHARIWES
jgi:hypothetical protein